MAGDRSESSVSHSDKSKGMKTSLHLPCSIGSPTQTSSCPRLHTVPLSPLFAPEPRVALGMTWESVPSIRLLLGTRHSSRTSEGYEEEEGRIPSGRPEARVATLLKHPAQVGFHALLTSSLVGRGHKQATPRVRALRYPETRT